MRKIYSIMFAAVAIFTAASCQKEITGAPEVKGEPFYFTASIGAETKTALSDTKSVVWTLGDKVEVFDAKNDPVVFIATKINEDGTALFYSENFNAPENGKINAVYNNPEKEGVAFIHESTIGNLHIGGAHKAVANGFDPRYGILYGQGTLAEDTNSFKVSFTNVHSLLKFTIAGEVPNTITLKCNGARNICGLFAYDFENSKCTQYNPKDGIAFGGLGYITLTASSGFVSGETYYIPFIAGGNVGNGFSLLFDDKEVINTKETIENIPHNKIFDLGTVQFPEVTEEPEEPETPAVSATKVWDAAVPFGGGQDRNMTMDGEYVYVAQAAGGNGAIKAISIADPTQVKDVKVTTYTPAGTNNKNEPYTNGTHAVTCVRMLPNTDPTVNGGKDVLVASNLTTGNGKEKLTVYVWSNGIDADPNYFVIDSGTRRLGDKFTVKGTYKSGELHFFDFNDGNTVIRVNMKDGVAGLWGTPELAYATGRFAMPVAGASNIGECTIHPDATFDGDGNPTVALLTTNAVNGFFTHDSSNIYVASAWGTDPALTQTFGYNFFEHNGKDYIAYVKVAGDRNSAALNIIEDVNGAADFKGTLEAQKGLFTAPVNGTGNAGHGLGDCAVHQTADGTYVAVMGQNIGITLYKLD